MTSISHWMRDTVTWLWAADPLSARERELKLRALFLDTLGCAIAGFGKMEVANTAARLAHTDPGTVSLPGCAVPLSASGAAYAFALAACWDEACEGLARAHGRPGLHAIPPALALGIANGTPLREVLTAAVRGYEIGGRLGERMRIRPGMHVDGTWGAFGAVTAAASMLGLSSAQAYASLEAMACQLPYSLYLPIAEGANVRNTYVAEAAARGIRIAHTIAAGITAPQGALDDVDARALGEAGKGVAHAPDGEWLLEQGYLKPFAAVRHVHYGAAAALEWRSGQTSADAFREINSLGLDVYPEALTYCGNRDPQRAIQAQFSLSYGIAAALVLGDLGPGAYEPENLCSEDIRRLEALVVLRPLTVRSDERKAILHVGTSAKTHVITSENVPGDTANPLTGAALTEKFQRYVAPIIGTTRAATMLDAVMHASLDTPVRDIVA